VFPLDGVGWLTVISSILKSVNDAAVLPESAGHFYDLFLLSGLALPWQI
jgi:hypothetical protein